MSALADNAPRVNACIEAVMKRYPSPKSTAYFEAVHQELAPLARELERENAQLRAAATEAWNRHAAPVEPHREIAAIRANVGNLPYLENYFNGLWQVIDELRAQAAPDGWQLVPKEPTPEIVAGAAVAVWPAASPADIALARLAAPIVLMKMDAPGVTVDQLAAALATMAPAYRAMLAAAPAYQPTGGA